MAPRGVDRRLEIPLFDLRVTDQDIAAVAAVLRSGELGPGPRTVELEGALSARLGSPHTLAVSSGTAALHLAYLACGIGPGDQVIVPGVTFVATASAVIHAGGTPVFADILGDGDWSLDPDDVERRLTPRTRAVCAVHYGGYAAPVDRLADFCRDRSLALVEDVAHAPGATLHGRGLGTWGTVGAFSFFSNKVLSAGEGGLVVTDDPGLAASMRATAGSDDDGTEHEARLNYRLDDPRSALLLSRLTRMNDEIDRRRELTLRYREHLAAVVEVTVPYSEAQVAESACYVMPVAVRDAERRDLVRERMRNRHGVQTSVLYPAVHELAAYRESTRHPGLPQSEWLARTQITLPLYPHMTADEQDRVIDALHDAMSS
jgi:dTDP-4-amino-4,6-dideoxygalactose transaminase